MILRSSIVTIWMKITTISMKCQWQMVVQKESNQAIDHQNITNPSKSKRPKLRKILTLKKK